MICPVCHLPYDDGDHKIADFVGREKMCYKCYNKVPKVIALDFDATLADYDGWKGPHHKGELLEGAKEFLQELIDMGFHLHIMTSRPLAGIQQWLLDNEIDHLIKGVTNQKIAAFCYLDDRAISFNNDFEEALDKIKNFVPWYKEKLNEPTSSTKEEKESV